MFPEMVYIDTNAVLDIVEQRQMGQITEQYLNELVSKDGMITWSQHTIEEITDFFHVDSYKKIAKIKQIKNNHIKSGWKIAEDQATDQESRAVSQNVNTQVDKVVSFLEQYGLPTNADEEEVAFLTKEIYASYGGNRKDSKHVAMANLSGTNNILTQDSGYLRYPNINVYGASNQIMVEFQNSPKPSVDYIDFNTLFNKSDDINSLQEGESQEGVS